ncbi:LacI family DNA-binding transcriptional regulator [Nakamurella sp. PAMC28650]|uniref:LacI family DNA-binding transcriptional regulator n=1 Tax=Nakamurella sp. PAMC28650 TaxID=2762325 RepID=UPI00164CE3AE|nr:LacI family DNA-binding transcriptional regulator [Nakamurella sp. PAMC28650]QNK81045.1 LacI family DNA-binding transcriptional regulator [Nakamurella sp. PAMC28650]
MKRVTISDIAARAGISKGAVSYALNGLPGVSAQTRQRVQEIARELDWSPSQTARKLAGGRSNAVGLVLARPARLLETEPFYMEFIAGMEEVLSAKSISLLLQMAPDRAREAQTHRAWWRDRQVDGVVLVDLTVDDERIGVLQSLGVPTVVVGAPDVAGGFTCVWTDDFASMDGALRYLVTLGHHRIARVAGPAHLRHIARRTEAMLSITETLGTPTDLEMIVETDFTGESGARATRRLLTAATPPSVIIYDNDVMAVAGLSVAAELGRSVPRDLSLLAWDDSPLCRITHPTLSAMSRDIQALGMHTARRMLDLLAGSEPAAYRDSQAEFLPRGSTAPPFPAR